MFSPKKFLIGLSRLDVPLNFEIESCVPSMFLQGWTMAIRMVNMGGDINVF
jgi:hypothetical protein